MKQNNRRGNLIRIVVVVLIALVFGAAMLSSRRNNDDGATLPMPLGFGLSVITSGSMSPTLNVNDVAVIVPRDQYDVGDIVVFQNNGGLTIHRIIKKDGDKITTKGDYEGNSPDAPIKSSAIQGKMIFRIPFVGAILDLIRQPVVFIFLLCFAIFLFWSADRKEKQAERPAPKSDDPEAIKAEIEKLKKELKK